jgi:hypothetical protein
MVSSTRDSDDADSLPSDDSSSPGGDGNGLEATLHSQQGGSFLDLVLVAVGSKIIREGEQDWTGSLGTRG